MTSFTDSLDELLHSVDAVQYGKTRNYIKGKVSRLSPFISRGVISTRQVARSVLGRGHAAPAIGKFLQELAWRDYFQQVWRHLGDDINKDVHRPQPDVGNRKMPSRMVSAELGIYAIDSGIRLLYESGYMHNHLRMYVASVACNVGKSHWMTPARWMYYHLLDADWGSNALNWQWVAGAFSYKKYFANQENVNRYSGTIQRNSFLDLPYEVLEEIEAPAVLQELTTWEPKAILPAPGTVKVDKRLPTYLYNFYNLDPNWGAQVQANRILLLEPGFFEAYPVCSRTMDFVIGLGSRIKGLQLYVGEFDQLISEVQPGEVHFKEHPTARHYRGTRHEREWMFPAVTGFYPSFTKFWRECEKGLEELICT